jgi:hypothetical protein
MLVTSTAWMKVQDSQIGKSELKVEAVGDIVFREGRYYFRFRYYCRAAHTEGQSELEKSSSRAYHDAYFTYTTCHVR